MPPILGTIHEYMDTATIQTPAAREFGLFARNRPAATSPGSRAIFSMSGLIEKRLGLLREIAPRGIRLAGLYLLTDPRNSISDSPALAGDRMLVRGLPSRPHRLV